MNQIMRLVMRMFILQFVRKGVNFAINKGSKAASNASRRRQSNADQFDQIVEDDNVYDEDGMPIGRRQVTHAAKKAPAKQGGSKANFKIDKNKAKMIRRIGRGRF